MRNPKLDNFIIVLPSLDPDERMPKTVRGMLDAGFPHVLIVNDGSKPEKLPFFEEAARDPRVTVIGYAVNKGKGLAMKIAFLWIRNHQPGENRPGPENLGDFLREPGELTEYGEYAGREFDQPVIGCVTVDGDDQHAPEDAVKCAEKMLETGHLVFGCRDFDDPSVPSRNRFGNKTTRAVFGTLIGIRISDAQTGLRAYPIGVFDWLLAIPGERFEYESNMILEMAEKKIPFEEVKIRTIYINGNTTSHFDPIKDSVKVYMPILKQAKVFRYLLGSTGSAVIDVAAFTVLNILLREMGVIEELHYEGAGIAFLSSPDSLRIFLATVFARIISSLCNYHWNRSNVFRSRAKKSTTMTRYYILCISQMIVAYALLYVLSSVTRATGFGETCLKMLVDLALFFISFRIQKHWVFR